MLLWQPYYHTNIIYITNHNNHFKFHNLHSLPRFTDRTLPITNYIIVQFHQHISSKVNIMSKTHHISYINLIYKRSYNLIYKKSYNLIYKNLIYKSHIQKSLYKVSYTITCTSRRKPTPNFN